MGAFLMLKFKERLIMHLADGIKIAVIGLAGGMPKDVPIQYGQLVIVPNYTIAEGEAGTARWTGLFDGPIKDGDSPMFTGEHAFFDAADKSFTKTAPVDGVTIPVGVFIDGGVLLTGELVPVAAAAEWPPRFLDLAMQTEQCCKLGLETEMQP